jgi:hypothetical protein
LTNPAVATAATFVRMFTQALLLLAPGHRVR